MTINKEKDGTFVVLASVRNPELLNPISSKRTTYIDSYGNRRKIKNISVARKVERKLFKELNEKATKKVHDQKVPNWETVVHMRKKQMEDEEHSSSGIHSFEKTVMKHTFPIWKERKIDSIEKVEVRKLLEILRESELADWTCISIHKYIKGVFSLAVDMGYINSDPTPKCKIEKSGKEYGHLSLDEAQELLYQAKTLGSEWYSVWAVALYTGMRNGELLGLCWEQVNLKSKQIRVDRAWKRGVGLKMQTKTGHNRIVPISDELFEILNGLDEKNGEASKFVLPRLAKWERGDQARELKFFLATIGLEPIRFHDLRASWCTMLLRKGVPIPQVMEMGGWLELKTMRNYLRRSGVELDGVTNCLNLLK